MTLETINNFTFFMLQYIGFFSVLFSFVFIAIVIFTLPFRLNVLLDILIRDLYFKLKK